MKLPILPVGHVSVMRAEVKTGIMVNNDNSRYQDFQDPLENGGKEYCLIFESLEDAKTAIESALKKDINYEFVINDYEGKYLECIGSPHWPIYRRKFNYDDIIFHSEYKPERGIARLMASFTQFFKKLRKK